MDGQDVLAVNELTQDAGGALPRRGEGPFFLELETYRYHGHHVGDINREYYRSKDEEEADWKENRDPIVRFRGWLVEQGIATEDEIESMNERDRDRTPQRPSPMPRPPLPGRVRSRHARLCHATEEREKNARDHPVPGRERGHRRGNAPRSDHGFLMGEDVAEAGTPFKVLSGLVEEFGTGRVIDTPIAEPGFVGLAVGAAMTGARPIVDLMFGDFFYLVMDQLCNQAAKQHYMSGGKLTVPMVLRTNLGATRRSAAQHSQSLQALVAHIPGLKVAMPSSAYEAKGLMKTADPRQQPGRHLRGQADVPGQGPGPGRGIPDPLR